MDLTSVQFPIPLLVTAATCQLSHQRKYIYILNERKKKNCVHIEKYFFFFTFFTFSFQDLFFIFNYI